MFRHMECLTISLLALTLSACGGAPSATSDSASPGAGFDNHTSATDAQLQELWQDAQSQLSTQQIPLNPVVAAAQGTPVTYVVPDPRASQVQPDGVGVYTVPDLMITQLQNENPGVQLQHTTDPTGVIHCPDNTTHEKYCVSYCQGNAVYVATSQLLNPGATGWEFQNIILMRLGYQISGR